MDAGLKEIAAFAELEFKKSFAAMNRDEGEIGTGNGVDDKGNERSIRRNEGITALRGFPVQARR